MYNDHTPYKVNSGTPGKMGEHEIECESGECDQCVSQTDRIKCRLWAGRCKIRDCWYHN